MVRDITDVTHPSSLAISMYGNNPQFASATDISFVQGPTFMRLPVSGSPATVAEPCHGGLFKDKFAWSADGAAATYISRGSDDSASFLHVVGSGQDRVVDSIANLPWTQGCPYTNCGEQFDTRLLFSPNGHYISLVQNLGGPSLRVWSSDGKVVASLDTEAAGMSVWSGSGLFFRDGSGVEVWRGGTQSLLLPSLAWIRPMASPAGGQIVYATQDGSGVAHVGVLDTTTGNSAGKTREIAKSRVEPVFLNSHLIWYREERPCVPADPPPCGGSVTTIETGTTYIYDLQDNTETESRITAVFDVWPHPA